MVHLLYEHPIGYILLTAQDIDALSATNILKSIENYNAFIKTFKVVGTLPHSDFTETQLEMEMAAEGKISSRLVEFLRINNVTKLAADKSYGLGLKDLGIKTVSEETSIELLRAVRKFINKVVDMDEASTQKLELSLAHAMSRKKVHYDSKREDNSVMQCISLIDETNIDINDYYMRIREMYAWHFPELTSICTDAGEYLEALETIGQRETADRKAVEALPSGTEILAAMDSTIGGDLSVEDLTNIKDLAEIVVEKITMRNKAIAHLETKMLTVAPNLAALVGNIVAARLILKAGGLSKLAMCPASTIQVLGAEKALFRAMKSKAKTPKYGLIFHSSFINTCALKMRGRISRYLSAKCAIASRIDCYSDDITSAYGEAMKEMVEERSKGQSTHHMPTDMVLARVTQELASQSQP
ncbi:nucleolar protein 56 [Nematocida homosporus]|uniref:nucleolar protein 56 n=1 Tax=Nematocida homosporus TaxID=1912981 RepID=UPI00221E456A|nr:nucleolar protein 56 [Nematocida homosporus]KAI5187553.1 nucleolar protein 56 [Nematocida homosporus]